MSTTIHTAATASATDAAAEPSTSIGTGGITLGATYADGLADDSGGNIESGGADSRIAPTRIWFARIAVGIVFFLNVMCAVQFIAWPEMHAPAYGLPSTPESHAMVAGLGVAFLMWNATYPPVLANPVRFRALFAVVLAQQAIGLVGESFIWANLAGQGLAASQMAHGIMRFIAFDGAGLVLMLVAFIVLHRAVRASGHHSSTSAW